MILPKNLRRVLFIVLLPFVLPGLVGGFSAPFTFSLMVVLCLWADGVSGSTRRRYARFGMILGAPWLLLSLVMLTGIYEYQARNVHIRLGDGLIRIHMGSAAAIAPMRWPNSPYVHGNWVCIPRINLRNVAEMAQLSLETVLSPPQTTLSPFGGTMTNAAGVPIDFFEIPVTAVLVTIGLPMLILRHGSAGRSHRPGHCDKCQFDLTGNTSGKCPECGLVIGGQSKRVTTEVSRA